MLPHTFWGTRRHSKNFRTITHIKENPTHNFTWKVIAMAPQELTKRKILEALFIKKFRPNLNDQVNSARLRVFPNGIS